MSKVQDSFSCEPYATKTKQKIALIVCFCYVIAYARSLVFVFMLMSGLTSRASLEFFHMSLFRYTDPILLLHSLSSN